MTEKGPIREQMGELIPKMSEELLDGENVLSEIIEHSEKAMTGNLGEENVEDWMDYDREITEKELKEEITPQEAAESEYLWMKDRGIVNNKSEFVEVISEMSLTEVYTFGELVDHYKKNLKGIKQMERLLDVSLTDIL